MGQTTVQRLPQNLHSSGVFTFLGCVTRIKTGLAAEQGLEGPLRALFDGCLLIFFGACQRQKHCNLQCF